MTIQPGKAHDEWSALKAKQSKAGGKSVDDLFKLDLGPNLDKFDTACKASDRAKARQYASKIYSAVDKYRPIAAKLSLANEFKTTLAEIEKYVTDQLQGCLPKSAPAGLKYMKQGGDGLCAFYALYHLSNGGLTKDAFLKRASKFYVDKLHLDDDTANELATDGNDPAVLGAFGLKRTNLGDKEAYVVADVGAGHFWTIRRVEDVWWRYDGLKGKPLVIGVTPKSVKDHVSGKELYA